MDRSRTRPQPFEAREISMASSTPSRSWTRRAFVQTIGSVSALGGVTSLAPWATAAAVEAAESSASPHFGYVACADDTIQVFSIAADGGAWKHVQTITSAAPLSLALSPDQRFLYVVNAVDSFEHMPTGSVEAFAVDAQTGRLTSLNRQRLALSAVMPSHITVSPNGGQIAVAIAGGAAYNLLPVLEDGSVGRVTASLKQIGSGQHPELQARALPQTVLFHDDSHLLGADLGSDRISAFSVAAGGALSTAQHHGAAAGSGPAHMVAHPSGNLVFTGGGLDPVVSSLRYNASAKQPLEPLQHLTCPSAVGGVTALAMHRSGTLLFVADLAGISIARTGTSGTLDFAGRQTAAAIATVALAASSDGAHLFALNRSSLTRFRIDLERASLLDPVELTRLGSASAIALRHL